jgi:hypothetical protein
VLSLQALTDAYGWGSGVLAFARSGANITNMQVQKPLLVSSNISNDGGTTDGLLFEADGDVQVQQKLGVGGTPTYQVDVNGKIRSSNSVISPSIIASETSDGADNLRLQLSGSPIQVSRGAYINIMGNEYSGQQGDLALLAGNSEVSGHGKISLYTGAGVERVIVTSSGTLKALYSSSVKSAPKYLLFLQ